MGELKLHPRNAAARRAAAAGTAPLVAGNSVATLLESGVGNCFPGLECDTRNLERRFFPFLEVDFDQGMASIVVAGVELSAAQAARQLGEIDAAHLTRYTRIAQAPRSWRVVRIDGDFGPLGTMQLPIPTSAQGSFGAGRLPVDAWTAVRLLRQDTPVTLRLRGPGGTQATLSGRRRAYFDPDGALAEFFEPGELTQSLCSPWTHDFRDCGCYYWASNHPDIALPPQIPGEDSFARGQLDTNWQRSERGLDTPEVATGQNAETAWPTALAHHELTNRWQELNFVVEGREQVVPYRPSEHTAPLLPNAQALVAHLRYAAGVELALTLEYLAAMWSLRRSAGQPGTLPGDLQASAFALLDIAVGEMRHLRAINDVLRRVQGAQYTPALAVASRIPVGNGQFRNHQIRPLTAAVLAEFVEVEAPSRSVDGLYGPILATLEKDDSQPVASETVRTIMAEGETHWRSFRRMSEWLGRHAEPAYLNATAPAPAGNAAQAALDQRYAQLLGRLHQGYVEGRIAGADEVNAAKTAMLAPTGIRGALDQVAAAGFVPRFATPADPRFALIPHPNGL
jgi:hypothetical protein